LDRRRLRRSIEFLHVIHWADPLPKGLDTQGL
jgi:hypothetical protein